MTLFKSDVYQHAKNKYYKTKVVVADGDVDALAQAVSNDYVMCEFKNNERSKTNFVSSNCLYGDIDNSDTDNQNDWMTIEKFQALFKDYKFYLITSRNHMIEKDEKIPRPKFHILFPVEPTTNAEELESYLKALTSRYGFFDASVKDCARFFFGFTDSEIHYNDGNSILNYLCEEKAYTTHSNEKANQKKSKTNTFTTGIQNGERNTKLFQIACKYREQGMNEQTAYIALVGINEAICEEPLDEKELKTIIKSAYSYSGDTVIISEEDGKTCFDEKYVLVFLGSDFIVWDIKEKKELSLNGLSNYHNKLFVETIKKIKGETVKILVNAVLYWFNHTTKRFKRMVFKPSELNVGEEEYNQWKGFACEENPNGNCDLFLSHIRENICSNNAILYDFLLDWMSQIIQYPEKKWGIAVALRGEQGSGKGFFAHHFGFLFGEHFTTINDIDNLLRQFNAHFQDKLLIFCDEALWGGDRSAESILKNLITEPKFLVERKFHEQEYSQSFKRLLLATNHDWVAPVSWDDRRYVILDVRNIHKKDVKYFETIEYQLKNEGGYGKLLSILKHRDISGRNWMKLPMTKAKVDNIIQGFGPVEKWIYKNLCEGVVSERQYNNINNYFFFKNDTEQNSRCEKFYELFKAYNGGHTNNKYVDEREVGKVLNIYFQNLKRTRETTGERKWLYIIPPLAECREAFANKLNWDFDWDNPV